VFFCNLESRSALYYERCLTTHLKIATTILLLLLATTSLAQSSTPKEEVYKILRTANIFNLPYRETARKAFNNYISKYSTSPYRLVAIYWLAEIIHKFENVDSSAPLYKQVLAVQNADSVDDAHFRHSSAIRLAEISIAKNDYVEALNYLDLAKQKFIPRYDCGYARVEDARKMNVLYSSCYIEQGNYGQAIDILTPYMIASWYSDDTIVIGKLYEAYLGIHTREEIKNEFLNAEKNVDIKHEQNNTYSYFQPSIRIFDKEIKFNDIHYNLNKLTAEERKQKCTETIRQSIIYKLATR
jgi:hypothetical protein